MKHKYIVAFRNTIDGRVRKEAIEVKSIYQARKIKECLELIYSISIQNYYEPIILREEIK